MSASAVRQLENLNQTKRRFHQSGESPAVRRWWPLHWSGQVTMQMSKAAPCLQVSGRYQLKISPDQPTIMERQDTC